MYTTINFRTKKALKDAITAGQVVTVFQPNNFMGCCVPTDGRVFLEGPHYPEPHRWYAEGMLAKGQLIHIK